ncbi:MAG: hypothetical protein CO133_00420 [Candidatus Komeilibacteria bacterium CG_4_9_14_3_um_filter_37_5]|nr:MAG: hypothetical protein CO133_00420 [Candidatus Komeilibacteria bacterium CG_4_9_14_3_um_filter_37_5]
MFSQIGLSTPWPLASISSSQSATKSENQEAVARVTEEKLSVERVVETAGPAVVSVIATKEISQLYNQIGSLFPWEEFFSSPFGFNWNGWPNQQPQQPSSPQPTEKKQVGAGTGFIISHDGIILTNKHVVEDEQATYSVILANGKKYEATVLGRDAFNDLAVIKIAEKNLPTLQLGDSGKIKIGETVVAIGNALGEYSNTVTTGIVSGLGREIEAGNGLSSEKLEGVIQTDAAINPGNSGGPLLNLYGQVIGINTAVNQAGQLIGFAIPINTAKQVVDSVNKYGKIVRPFLGVRYVILNDAIAQQNKIDFNYGALIIRGQNREELAVMPGSPADLAGLVENDIILEINNVKLDRELSLAKEVAKHQPGDKITLKVCHRGQTQDVVVQLAEYK